MKTDEKEVSVACAKGHAFWTPTRPHINPTKDKVSLSLRKPILPANSASYERTKRDSNRCNSLESFLIRHRCGAGMNLMDGPKRTLSWAADFC